jgi:3-hydroxyacyl-[acyl-carrier-protein] dehydratase
MLATRETILNFIPQRHPVVMIHNIVEADDNHCVTELAIEPDNIFVEDGRFMEPGLIENIAQTAAAHVGYQCSIKKIPVPIGYIAAVKNLRVFDLPPVNQTIKTFITIKSKVMDVTLAEGTVESGNHTICSCEMRIFVKS